MERVRGTIDIPLTPEGRKETSQWATWFKDRGRLDVVYHSSLIRDEETAQILGKSSRATLVGLGDLLFPQDQGKFSGMPKEEAEDKLAPFFDNPYKTIPGGQSLDTFKRIYLPVFWDILRMSKGRKVALVTHGSNIQLVNGWLMAGAKASWEVDPGAMGLKVRPDGVFYLDPWDFLSNPPCVLSLAERAPLASGLYQIRHGRTAWSAK